MKNERLISLLEKEKIVGFDHVFFSNYVLDIRSTTLNHLKAGTYKPSLELAFKLSIMLGVSPVELFNDLYCDILFDLQESGNLEIKGRDIKDTWRKRNDYNEFLEKNIKRIER